jgi:hypothetical protein
VQQLTPNDLTSDGQYDVIHMTDDVESPAMFYRKGTYYITMSDPTCGTTYHVAVTVSGR